MNNHGDYFYNQYYSSQSGGSSNIQEVGTIYSQNRFSQKGYGFGGLFSSLYSYLKPLLISGLNILKDTGLQAGANILSDLTTQKPIREIIKTRGKEAITKLTTAAVKKMRGGGRKIKKAVKRIAKGVNIKGRLVKNKRQSRKKVPSIKKYKSGVKRSNKRILDIFN